MTPNTATPAATANVTVAIVKHRHGANVHVGATAADARHQVADYCRSWWEETRIKFGPDLPATAPSDDEETIALYFDVMGFEESVTFADADLANVVVLPAAAAGASSVACAGSRIVIALEFVTGGPLDAEESIGDLLARASTGDASVRILASAAEQVTRAELDRLADAHGTDRSLFATDDDEGDRDEQ